MSSPSTPSPTAHYLTRSHPRQREGRLPRPLLGDVIATPRHHIASEQQPAATGQRLDGLQSSPPRPRPLPLPSLPSGGEEGKSKGANETEREGTRAKDAAAIFASSSPLFCSVCCLHCPHHRQPLTASPARNIAKGEGRTVTPSASGRCYRHTSPATRRAAPRQSSILPASSSSSPLFPFSRW